MPTISFQDMFFTRTMHQQFNVVVANDEAPIHHWLRTHNRI